MKHFNGLLKWSAEVTARTVNLFTFRQALNKLCGNEDQIRAHPKDAEQLRLANTTNLAIP